MNTYYLYRLFVDGRCLLCVLCFSICRVYCAHSYTIVYVVSIKIVESAVPRTEAKRGMPLFDGRAFAVAYSIYYTLVCTSTMWCW